MNPETGEISELALKELDALEMARDEKALAVARYLLGEKAEGDAVKTQADRLARRARAHHGRADRLKAYLETFVPAGTKLRDDVVQIGWRKSSAVQVPEVDYSAWPERFRRVTVAPDKAELTKALKDGEDVPSGVRLVERTGIQIR